MMMSVPEVEAAVQDNALKQWVFDALDGSARLLRFRSGHAAPPTCLTHYGEAGTRLLSAGIITLRNPEELIPGPVQVQACGVCVECGVPCHD